jgi:hypothetical protein
MEMDFTGGSVGRIEWAAERARFGGKFRDRFTFRRYTTDAGTIWSLVEVWAFGRHLQVEHRAA